MLIEMAIGDAYGCGFEMTDNDFVAKHNDGVHYQSHPGLERKGKLEFHTVRPGFYTDDTQMSIAVVEAMLSPEPWSRELLAGKFVEAYKRDPRTAYARRFQQFLDEVKTGQEFLEKIRPNSDRSGAAMRAAPLGVLPNLEEALEKCELQARITHDTTDGVLAAKGVTAMAHYFVHRKGGRDGLASFLGKAVPGPAWGTPWVARVGVEGLSSARAAVTAVMSCDSLLGLLRACVAYTGDVDTVASMAMAAASCSTEYKKDIPAQLLDGLEDGAYGKRFIRDLDARLMDLAGLDEGDRWAQL